MTLPTLARCSPIILALLACCLGTPGATAQDLAGTSWQGDRIRLDFDHQRFSGRRRCNRIGGGYRLREGTVRFEGVVSTRVYCAGAGIPVLLRGRLRGPRLDLLDERGAVVMTLIRAGSR